MGEGKEGYWSKHHTGVIQCVFALYCSVLGTLQYIYTRSAPATSAAPSSSGGTAMTHGYSMPLYLWLGIIALCLSVAIPAIIRMIRHRPTELFRPLQIDAISLAIELAKFSKEMHERPDFVLPTFEDSVAGTVARVEFLQRRDAIIGSTYRQRFGDRLSQIVDRLGSEGVKRHFLDSKVAGDIHESIEAQTTANHLIGAAFELNGLYLYPPRTFTIFDLETMSGDEKARRIREEPGFAETTERYRMKNLIVRDE